MRIKSFDSVELKKQRHCCLCLPVVLRSAEEPRRVRNINQQPVDDALNLTRPSSF